MKLVIRYIHIRGTSKESHEATFVGDRATIGRGTNQSIQIQDSRIPLEHSVLRDKGGTLELRVVGRLGFTVNNAPSTRAELSGGDVVDILGHGIRLSVGEGDVDYVLEVDVESASVEPLHNRFVTRIWALNFPQRKLSWILFVAILLMGIGIPSIGFVTGMEFMRQLPLPDDSLWLAGDLHDTHAFMGDDCENCHTQPFVPARNEDCLGCHQSTNRHFDSKSMLGEYHIASECQDCHREHNGNDAMVRRDQTACSDCHENLDDIGYKLERINNGASDFLLHHPSFKVSLYQINDNAAAGESPWMLAREKLTNDPTEQSNLKFPHDVHLAEDGINGVDGQQVLQCADCHEVERSGQSYKPVSMQAHCAGCHELTFDPTTPDRVVPHGAPDELIEQLRGYYAYQFLHAEETSSAGRVEVSTQREARRPGQRAERRSIAEFQANVANENVTDQAKSYIDANVAEAANNLFERQTCTICHEVTRKPGAVAWDVANVKLTEDWFPMARFNHKKHETLACEGCHEAHSSMVSNDVLMPDIDICTVCHGGEHAAGQLQSTCIDCHSFHLDSQATMSGEPLGQSSDIMLDYLDQMFGDQYTSQTVITEE